MTKTKIVDKDRGYKKRMRELAKHGEVKVGILANADGTYDDGATVLQIGTVHEYGSEIMNIPSRSFIRATVDKERRELDKRMKIVGERIADGADTKQMLNKFGAAFKGDIQKRISEGIPPELQPETIARKGSSKPLIDTGILRSSIDYISEVKK